MKSDQAHRNANSDTVTIALRLTGRTIDRNVRHGPAPSIFAACEQLVRDAGHERGEDQHPERHGEGGVGEDQARDGVEHARG